MRLAAGPHGGPALPFAGCGCGAGLLRSACGTAQQGCRLQRSQSGVARPGHRRPGSGRVRGDRAATLGRAASPPLSPARGLSRLSEPLRH